MTTSTRTSLAALVLLLGAPACALDDSAVDDPATDADELEMPASDDEDLGDLTVLLDEEGNPATAETELDVPEGDDFDWASEAHGDVEDQEVMLDPDHPDFEALSQTLSYCGAHPNRRPKGFYIALHAAARYAVHAPDSWAHGNQARCLSKIACREADWSLHARNGSYRGSYQIHKDHFPMGNVTLTKYWSGGRDRNGVMRSARFWQQYAALQYVIERPDYAAPCGGWASHLRRGWW